MKCVVDKKGYIGVFFGCALVAVVVKRTRSDFFGMTEVTDFILGSCPSFLFIFGFMALFQIPRKTVPIVNSVSSTNLTLIIITASLIYEIGQNWTHMFFDWRDIVAIFLAPIAFHVTHSIYQSKV